MFIKIYVCIKWWSTNVGAKLMPDLVMILTFSSDIPLDFHKSILAVPLKYLISFLADINTNINNFEIFLKINILLH